MPINLTQQYIWTHIFEWYVTKRAPKNEHPKNVFKETRLHAQYILTDQSICTYDARFMGVGFSTLYVKARLLKT